MPDPLYTLYDSDNPLAIPVGNKAAGYDDGYAANAWAITGWSRFPDALHITIFGLLTSQIFDIETGGGLPSQAGPWAAQKKTLGKIGIIYVNRSNGYLVQQSLQASGLKPTEVVLWIATDDGTTYVTVWDDGSPVEYPIWAVQYLNESHGSGGHYDLSLVYLAFGDSSKGEEMIAAIVSTDTQGQWFLYGSIYFHISTPQDRDNLKAAYNAVEVKISDGSHANLRNALKQGAQA